MKSFQYHEPTTPQDVCGLLHTHGDSASIIAGGTDLIIKMERGVKSPSHVISIRNIKELDSIVESDEGFAIGANVSLTAVAEHEGIKSKLPVISKAAKSIGSVQVRNLATALGNLCNAAPSADMAPGLLVLNARVMVQGIHTSREVPLSSLFAGPGTLTLEPGEFATKLFIPLPEKELHTIYIKHAPRQAMEIAIVGVAVAICVEPDTMICKDVRVALGAVAPTPVRASEVENLIMNTPLPELTPEIIQSAVGRHASPISDVRSSADYRAEMISTLIMRAVDTLIKEEE